MKPTKIGQVVKYHTPFPDEDPNQQYVVLEIKDDVERPRVDIKALNTGLSFSPIHTVPLRDLIVVEVKTTDLIGSKVTINKADRSQAIGKVVKVREEKIYLDLTKGAHGVETNVCLTIADDNGEEQTGTLFVKP
jgi:hypothetical protein